MNVNQTENIYINISEKLYRVKMHYVTLFDLMLTF